jgi:serine phosphatase RsbU (regulator of sigma subunit)
MLAILIYRFSRTSAQEERMAGELSAAQAVQSILIPEEIPKLPGFAIESVYRPASQVGGDFFQILPTASGGVLAVIGDVSGKGVPAAMIVSLLVGTLRTLAESTDSPAVLLDGLNRRLVGRSSGFTTCLILRADPDGTCVVANAGHLPPYVDGREVEMDTGLVLGITAEASYEETVLHLEDGARITLLTDGVVEARSRTGELYGFERTEAVAGAPAAQIAAEAQAFGQEDDITVVSVTRAVTLKTVAV